MKDRARLSALVRALDASDVALRREQCPGEPGAIARLDAGEAQADVARSYGVAHTTIGRLVSAPAM